LALSLLHYNVFKEKVMNKQILRLAIPNIITNITVPLLGMVDTAIVGHLKSDNGLDYIGAIAVGTMIFNIIYWNFGFLRMGTSGFTAQAYGANDKKEQANILLRASAIAIVAALILIICQKPIGQPSLMLIEDKNSVGALALSYFAIRIWAAPATLGMYALKGWFIGMQDSKNPMWISIIINILNIAFSFVFVFYFDMSIQGVAWGTVIAQYGGLITTLIIWKRKYGYISEYFNIKDALSIDKMQQFFKINSDIFLRTLCLIIVTSYFTIASTKMPYPTLAMNTLLMQFFTLFSYFMDGFAFAGEAMVGKAIGARARNIYDDTVKHLFRWGWMLAALFSALYFLLGKEYVSLLTDDADVIASSLPYQPWTLLIPICGVAAFIWDGIYIGATATKGMLVSMASGTFVFFLLYMLLVPMWGNHGLWASFIAYLAWRGVSLTLTRKKVWQ
jgi:MATE family multidrug resistance protein